MTQIVTDRNGDTHEFPDNATPGQIVAAMGGQRQHGGLRDAIIDAATFGLSDEAKAAGSAAGSWLARHLGMKDGESFSKDYETALAVERAKLADLTLAQRIVGGAIGGLASGPAKAGTSIIKQAAIQGGLYGAGSGEGGAEQRATSGAIGAGVGAATAGLTQQVAAGAGRLVQTLTDKGAAAERRANEVIAKALAREGITPEDLAARMTTAAPGTTVAEAGGEPTQRLARAVANTPGESGKLASDVLGERSRQMGEDITNAARQQLGQGNAYGAFDVLRSQQQAAAKPLYEAAYAKPMPFNDTLDAIISTPAGKKAIGEAATIAKNEGTPIPEWFTKLSGKAGDITQADMVEAPSTRVWHLVRQALDDQVEKYRNAVGKLDLDTAGRAVVGLRNKLGNEMQSLNPDLAKADAMFAETSAAKDAMQKGLGFMRSSPEQLSKIVDGMSDGAKGFFRLGVAQAIEDRMNNVALGNSAVSRMADVPAFQAKVRAVFPDDQSAQVFNDLITAKREQQGFKNMVLSGSRTTPLAQDINDLGTSRLQTAIDAAKAARGDTNALTRLGSNVLDRWRAGFSEETRNQIGQKLLSQQVPDAASLTAQQPLNPEAVAQGARAAGQAVLSAVTPNLAGVTAPQEAGTAAPEVSQQAQPQQQQPIDWGSVFQSMPQGTPGSKINWVQEFAPSNDRGNMVKKISSAIQMQESGGNPNAVSVQGAQGSMQIMPATFRQYAKPGEDIRNPLDNVAVGQRIIGSLYDKYGDPRMVAAAYFSGRPDYNSLKVDGNGKTVRSYVQDVMGRIAAQDA